MAQYFGIQILFLQKKAYLLNMLPAKIDINYILSYILLFLKG